jgi:hypothetical protein
MKSFVLHNLPTYRVPSHPSKPANFKTFSILNYLEIKTQLIRFGQILTKHQIAGKPTKEFGMMCLRLLNDHSGTFFNKMAIFKTFQNLLVKSQNSNLFKALEFFFRIFFQTVGTLHLGQI